MMANGLRLRPANLADLDVLMDLYRESFERELDFFYRRFCGCYFRALFRLLVGDIIVAEVKGEVVGFIIAMLGLRPLASIDALRLISTLPMLLLSAKPFYFVHLLQKARSGRWKEQVALLDIAVRRSFQRKGIAKALNFAALSRYPGKTMALQVRSWNASAIRLASGFGFEKSRSWRDPLGEWIIMRRIPTGKRTCK